MVLPWEGAETNREGRRGAPLWCSRGRGQKQIGRAVKALPYQARQGVENPEKFPRRKQIRLPPEAYANPANVFFITIDALRRQRFFDDRQFNDTVTHQLRTLCVENRCPVKIYCLMPTHLHLLISPGAVSLLRCIARFKQLTQHLAKQRGICTLWQRSFFDHCLRSSEREAETIEYIRVNPVRGGLVEHPDDWPWTGSVVW
jgi:REP-associated tyrosine transposase